MNIFKIITTIINMYVLSSKAQQFYGVSDQTLRRWAEKNKIEFRRTSGQYKFKIIGEEDRNLQIIYARVSSSKQ